MRGFDPNGRRFVGLLVFASIVGIGVIVMWVTRMQSGSNRNKPVANNEAVQLLTATSVMLAWNPNTELDLTGYRVYYGTAPSVYATPIPVGAGSTAVTINTLSPGTTYYGALTAVTNGVFQSPFSNEVTFTTQSYTPTPSPTATIIPTPPPTPSPTVSPSPPPTPTATATAAVVPPGRRPSPKPRPLPGNTP